MNWGENKKNNSSLLSALGHTYLTSGSSCFATRSGVFKRFSWHTTFYQQASDVGKIASVGKLLPRTVTIGE
jgi:hypothetical protein